MTKMKELAESHSTEPIKFYVVFNPADKVRWGSTILLDNKIFKATSKYDLWLQINGINDILFEYEAKHTEKFIYDLLEEAYDEAPMELRIDTLINHEINWHGKKDAQYCWQEVNMN